MEELYIHRPNPRINQMGSKKANTGTSSEREVGENLGCPLFLGKGDPLAVAEHPRLGSPE